MSLRFVQCVTRKDIFRNISTNDIYELNYPDNLINKVHILDVEVTVSISTHLNIRFIVGHVSINFKLMLFITTDLVRSCGFGCINHSTIFVTHSQFGRIIFYIYL